MNNLLVLLGPTGIGKTELSLLLAEYYGCPILNCDSRQLFRDLKIGTAAPTSAQLARAEHHFVGTLALDDYYSAARYEEEAMKCLTKLFEEKGLDTVILSGGSMMYIDAVCKGIDDIPTIGDATRQWMKERLKKEGLESLLAELKRLDPAYYEQVDRHNTRRVVHALEVCHTSGRTYSSFRTQNLKERPFHIIKVGLQRSREELFARINQRVDRMREEGLLEEAMRHFQHRHLNALNTVGYKEIFEYLDHKDKPEEERRTLRIKGKITTLEEAFERIKKNTRVYAKKQMTWFAKDPDIHWFHPDDLQGIMSYIDKEMSQPK